MKRLFDIAVSAMALFLLAPVIGLVALLVWTKLGSPVFFRQIRPGRQGKPFEMIKFRTMGPAVDAVGKSLTDNERLHRFGRILRASSLDELPELLNVLRGEMSLVGPRPLLMQYLELYTTEQWRRHEVRPGITGWAQVNGRNTLSWNQKFAYDLWYVDNRSLFLDLKIIALTVIGLLRPRGISAEGEATMPIFTGGDETDVSSS